MRRFSRFLVCVIVTALLAMGIAGAAAAQTKLTILVSGIRGEVTNTHPDCTMECAAIERFKARHPGVEVEFVGGDTLQLFPTMVAGGVSVDLVASNINHNLGWIADGMILDLTPYVERDKEFFADWFPHVLEMQKINGRTWFLTRQNLATYAIWYNGNKLSAAGVDFPGVSWTDEDFVEIGRRVTAQENDEWAYSWNAWQAYLPWVHNRGFDFVSSDLRRSRLTSPESIEALEWLLSLRDELGIVPTSDLVPDARQAWLDGRTAFVTYTPLTAWGDGIIEDRGMLPQPAGPARAGTMFTVGALMIPTASANPDLAWELLKEFVSEETVRDLVAEIPGFPVTHRSVMSEWIAEVGSRVTGIRSYQEAFQELAIRAFVSAIPPVPAQADALFNEALARVFNEGVAPAAALAEIEGSFQAYLDSLWND